MRVAAVDLGTNTFLCLVADISKTGEVIQVLSDQARVVRLGQGVNVARAFHPDALSRADACLLDFAKEIARHKVDRIVACATSAARDVSNGADLLNIGRKHGIEIEIISGEREAESTYWGTVGRDLKGSVGIIDVGGGSTEFIIGDKTGIQKKISVDVGSVRMTESFVTSHPVKETELRAMESHIRSKFSVVSETFKEAAFDKIVAVAGTPTTIAALDMGKPFDAESVHGYSLTTARLQSWTGRLAAMTIREREVLSGMDPKRADVIVAGAMVLKLACEAFGGSDMEVSVRGLRYGLAILAGRNQ